MTFASLPYRKTAADNVRPPPPFWTFAVQVSQVSKSLELPFNFLERPNTWHPRICTRKANTRQLLRNKVVTASPPSLHQLPTWAPAIPSTVIPDFVFIPGTLQLLASPLAPQTCSTQNLKMSDSRRNPPPTPRKKSDLKPDSFAHLHWHICISYRPPKLHCLGWSPPSSARIPEGSGPYLRNCARSGKNSRAHALPCIGR
jgi:hypothetical protein